VVASAGYLKSYFLWGEKMSNRRDVSFGIPLTVVFLFFAVNTSTSAATVAVDFSKNHQTIDGFGGCSAWSGKLTDAMMNGLYGNGPTQVGFTILRLRMDPKASAWADEKSNAAKAKERGATVFATPWAYPESLTTNGKTVKGYINPAKFASVAAHLKSFWTYCGEKNVDIMSLENEPDYAQSITYEGCTWTGQNFLDFCKTYAPQVGKPIMLPESFAFSYTLSDPTLNDATAAANITYIGAHLYGSGPKKYTKALDLKKRVWETEHYFSNDDAGTCMRFAKEVFDCMNCDFSAYVWWWMTYDSNSGGKDGLWANNAPNHRAWVLAQFSKWVRPGFIRVDATYNPQSGVNVVAFKGDSNVVVAMNNSTSSQSITFSYTNATVTSVSKYTSSQTKNGKNDGVIDAANNSFTTTLDAQSVTTFVSKGVPSGVIGINNDGLNLGAVSGRSDITKQFVYLINGKRGTLSANNDFHSYTQGIYLLSGKANANGKAQRILNTSNK
jgi:glucuronoarabinoxylan endo-1,4-beta-xylanase